jgi:hypothetical protein
MEYSFTCPYCGEEISMVLDVSVGRQTYIEDCEVCCKPIEISFTVKMTISLASTPKPSLRCGHSAANVAPTAITPRWE